jgi:3-polyprenyl-4-hydroxybenzoate decarboxylase
VEGLRPQRLKRPPNQAVVTEEAVNLESSPLIRGN